MNNVIEFSAVFAGGIVTAMQMLMLVRAVLSWFPGSENSAFSEAVYSITEPLIIPVRIILDRFESVRNFPLDLSFFVTFFILSFVGAIFFP